MVSARATNFSWPDGLQVGSHERWVCARAWVPSEPTQTGASTYRGTRTGRRSGQEKVVLAAGDPPTWRVLDPFLALV